MKPVQNLHTLRVIARLRPGCKCIRHLFELLQKYYWEMERDVRAIRLYRGGDVTSGQHLRVAKIKVRSPLLLLTVANLWSITMLHSIRAVVSNTVIT